MLVFAIKLEDVRTGRAGEAEREPKVMGGDRGCDDDMLLITSMNSADVVTQPAKNDNTIHRWRTIPTFSLKIF